VLGDQGVTDIHVINWTIEEAKLLKAERPQPGDVDPIPSLDQLLVWPEGPVDSAARSSPLQPSADMAPVLPSLTDAVAAPEPKAESKPPVELSFSRAVADRIETVMGENQDKSSAARELAAPAASPSEIATELARAEAATKARTVNKVTWAQVGRVTEPGRYMLRFGWVTITVQDLAIWEQYPNAAFTFYTTGLTTDTEEKTGEKFRLGIFELRQDWNVPQNER
jgi:hypothetical protein